jgi:hypothetical protein
MASVELTTEQVINLVRQLPAASKKDLLLALASESQSSRAERMALAERQLSAVAAKRGLNWASMSDDERQALADDLIHEDRSCRE